MNSTSPVVEKPTFNRYILLPLLPVLFFFMHNAAYFTQLIFTWDVLLLFLIYTAFAYLLFACCRFILRLMIPSSLFISCLAITGFLFFGPMQDHLYLLHRFHFLSNSFFLLAMIVAVILVLYLLVRRKTRLLLKINLYLLSIFWVLIVVDLVLLTRKLSSGNNAAALSRRMVSPVLTTERSNTDPPPDIYHIVFDSYASMASLKQYWNYDNEISTYLTSKGFFVLDSATSNYKSTPYSVASTFNLQYLEGAEFYQYSNSSNFLLGQRVYKNNELFRFLKKNGYTFSIFSQLEDKKLLTNFGALGVAKPNNWLRKQTMERIYRNPWLLEKINRLFRKSSGQPAIIRSSMNDFHQYNLKAQAHILSDCREYATKRRGGAVFSFTHFMIPHDPYVIDENGEPVNSPHPENADMSGYLKQVKYCNKLIQQISDCLLRDTTRKKIIIIQGDHGYRHFTNVPSIEPFAALDAIYFYTGDYSGMEKTGSLVNTYRIVINKFFGGRLPLLESRIIGEKYKDN